MKYHAKKIFVDASDSLFDFWDWHHRFRFIGMNDIRHAGPFLLATYAVTFLVAIYFFIWNIVKGIKVFSEQ